MLCLDDRGEEPWRVSGPGRAAAGREHSPQSRGGWQPFARRHWFIRQGEEVGEEGGNGEKDLGSERKGAELPLSELVRRPRRLKR